MMQKARIEVEGPELEVGDFIVECRLKEHAGTNSPWSLRVTADTVPTKNSLNVTAMRAMYRDRQHIFTVEREVEVENDFGPISP